MKSRTITVRLSEEQYARLHGATALGPYRVALAEVVIRGIELAAKELERIAQTAAARNTEADH